MKPVRWSSHALEKLKMLREWGFALDERSIEEAVLNPDEVFPGYLGRRIAQSVLDEFHILRVVYEEGEEIVIITFYPARRGRYED